jgi:uncharacterized membrane protein
MLAAVTAYEVSVFLHVTAVVVGFGATFAESILFPVAMKLDRRHLPYLHAVQLAINRWLALPATAVILITGFYQVADGNWSLGEFWISATIGIVIVLVLLNLLYFIPADQRLQPMVVRELEAGGDLSEEYQRRARAEGMVGAFAGILVIAAIFLMVVKPGA